MTAPASTRGSRARFALRDRPTIVWLGLAAVVALAHPFVPEADWLLVHLVLLGALTHSAMVWSTHFAQALLKTPESLDDRSVQNRRILLLQVGAAAVLVGVPGEWWPLTIAGATAVTAAVTWHGWALWRRLRHALPGRFRVSVHYYLTAAAAVPVGATLGVWLAHGLEGDPMGRVVVAHSMVMVLGWTGLTVTGTLVTLWPTMLRTRMDHRAERLARQALPVLVVALLVLASGRTGGVPGRGTGRARRVRSRAGLVGPGAARAGPARPAALVRHGVRRGRARVGQRGDRHARVVARHGTELGGHRRPVRPHRRRHRRRLRQPSCSSVRSPTSSPWSSAADRPSSAPPPSGSSVPGCGGCSSSTAAC